MTARFEDTLDFVVGWGNGSYGSDSTALTATITSTAGRTFDYGQRGAISNVEHHGLVLHLRDRAPLQEETEGASDHQGRPIREQIRGTISGMAGQATGVQCPDVDALRQSFGQTLSGLDGLVAQVQANVQQGIAGQSDALNGQATETAGALEQVAQSAAEHGNSVAQSFAAATARWRARLSDVTIDVPADTQLTDAIRASAGWILATRKGAALEPGTRSYDRSWIRDGALMAAALLRFGYSDVVRDYIAWYAAHQYPSGKVPCCVDARGADPVPEHDSNGEFIYLVMEYWRHTGDRALLERMWPHVVRAVGYPFLFANGFVLLTVTFVPFPTAVLAEHLATTEARAAVTFYCGAFVLAGLAWYLLFMAIVRGGLLRPEVDVGTIGRIRRAYMAGAPVYAVATLVALVQPALGLALNASLWLLWVRLSYYTTSEARQRR